MGGGDLNMKKSWHPQTMRNIERVWKKEENHASEQRKIEELQKELQDERAREEMQRFAVDTGAVGKQKDKLDWMYQGLGGAVNREDYLLGKPVDKAILDVDSGKTESSTQDGASNSVGAIFDNSSVNLAVDMAVKVREDPLFAIKKREEQSKKDLLTNPVKMKQLQDMLRKNLSKKEKKRKKKEKKHRRSHKESSDEEEDNRKHRHAYRKRRNSSTSNEKTSPEKIRKPEGYGLINGKRQHSPSRREDNSRDRSPDQRHISDKHREHRTKWIGDMQRQSSDTYRDRHRDKESDKHTHSKRDRYSDRNDSRHTRSRSHSPFRRKARGHSKSPVRRYRSPERSPVRRHRSPERSPVRRHRSPERSPVRRHRSPERSPLRRYRSPERSHRSSARPPVRRHRSPEGRQQSPPRYRSRSRSPVRKLSEKYERRPRSRSPQHSRPRSRSPQHSRPQIRSRSPQHSRPQIGKKKPDAEELERRRREMMDNAKWRGEQRKERVQKYKVEDAKETEMEKNKSKDAEFLEPLKLPAALSVEQRIKSKINSIQRTNAALDKNFAKR